MKLTMDLCPSRKEWQEYANKTLASGCIDLDAMEDNYRDIYPVAAAILHCYMDRHLKGSMYDRIRRKAARDEKNIYKFI